MAEVDLESHVLVNKGLSIEIMEGMGRVAVATKPLDNSYLYQVVLCERPLLVWEVGDMEDFVHQFQSAPQETQDAIMDMFHPPLDSDSSPIIAKFRDMAGPLAEATGTDVTWAHKILAICATNAHKFYSGKTTSRKPHSAIFAYASKIAHSCIPNLAYTSVKSEDDNNQGALQYKVIRNIPMGQPAAFSYIGGGRVLYQTPTHERREKLWRTKSFVCQCKRCSGPDYCRSVQCNTCTQKMFVPCIYNNEENDYQPTWTCRREACGIRNSQDIQLQEKLFDDRLQALFQQHQQQTDNETQTDDSAIQALQDLIEESKTSLSPVHHITIQALETLAKWTAANAAVTKETIAKGGLFKIAAEASLQVVLGCECVASGCPGCFDAAVLFSSSAANGTSTGTGDVLAQHDPIYEMGVTAFTASKLLMHVPEASRPPHAMSMIQRYLPIIAQLAAP
ncbi:SET domain [Seminavis robusta]|uniref:SET domain n=1 Tax=Seminavis robusta TaxID=568900 RepID=A0A9N8DIR3_9STRA|nr:SET domain [Seminavis robusta]|eukprot:Sro149_g068500.1 SET domain (450) ;mRNA; f:59186-60535